jgi:hypothetical protein
MKKFIGWILAIIATIIGGIVVFEYSNLPQEVRGKFWSFNWFATIMNTEYELWHLVVFFVILIGIVFLIRFLLMQRKQSAVTPNPIIPTNPNKEFTEFRFAEFKWRWSYMWDISDQRWIVNSLNPVCPVCNRTMELDVFDSYCICSSCRLNGRNYDYHLDEYKDDILKEIEYMRGNKK